MPSSGKLIILPFRIRPVVPDVPDEVLRLPEVEIPTENYPVPSAAGASRDDIVKLYEIFLGREPENDGAITGRVGRPLAELIGEFTASDEYRARFGVSPATPPAIGTRRLLDSVTARDIPQSADLVAGYVDGRFAWSPADWARFGDRARVRIAVLASTNDGNVLDVEIGNSPPDQAPGWVQMRRAAGVDPSVYCDLSTWPRVRAAFAAAGVAQPHYWIASWDNDPSPIAGAVAKQYANPDLTGGHYDASIVFGAWPGID